MFVEISNEQAEELQEYADFSGVPIKQSVAEALESLTKPSGFQGHQRRADRS